MKDQKLFEVRAEIVFNLTQEDIDDIMVSALEGGINYWCSEAEVIGEYLGEYASEQISRGGMLALYDSETGGCYDFELDDFLRGFRFWVENGDDIYGAVSGGKVDPGNIDGEMADMIVQYGIFGEVVFG